MMQLCLGLAGVIWAQLPVTGFTLAWQHSVERIRWEEDYRVEPSGLRLQEARVRGSGAGMEIPEDAVLRDGSWHYRPQLAPLAQLRLARSTAERAADYQLCTAGQCRALAHWLGPPSAGQPVVELWSCAPGGGLRPKGRLQWRFLQKWGVLGGKAQGRYRGGVTQAVRVAAVRRGTAGRRLCRLAHVEAAESLAGGGTYQPAPLFSGAVGAAARAAGRRDPGQYRPQLCRKCLRLDVGPGQDRGSDPRGGG